MLQSRRIVVRTVLVWLLLELVAAAQVRHNGEAALLQAARFIVRPIGATASAAGQVSRDLLSGLADTARLIGDRARLRSELESVRSRYELARVELAALRAAREVAVTYPHLSELGVVVACTYRDFGAGLMEAAAPPGSVVGADTPVLSARGVVGRVVRGSRDRVWIEVLTRPGMAVAVRTEPDGLPGILVGTGTGRLQLHYVPRRARLVVGTVLVTSGADGVYPPGLPTAVVTSVRESSGPFLEVSARPSAEPENLDVVLLVTGWPASPRGRRR